MKIAILNDTHCGKSNSSDVIIKQQELFYSKVFFPYLKKNNIKRIIHGGDYFDSRKSINIKAISENRKHFLKPLEEYEMDIIVGNHDAFYYNTNDLSSIHEILKEYKNINIISETKDIVIDGRKICMVPWINRENYDHTIKVVENSDAEICIGHFEFAGFKMNANSFESNKGTVSRKHFHKFKMVLSGHFHHKSNKDNIDYLGSQMQFTWHDYNDPKFFHVLDTDTLELEAIENPYTLFEEIHYHPHGAWSTEQYKDKIVRMYLSKGHENTKTYTDFLERIKEIAHEVNVIVETEVVEDEHISLENIMDTPVLMKKYINEIETSLDKDKIAAILTDLYNEAS